MASFPRVDVNLFVYNGETTVGPVIESLLAQTWPDLQIALFDDGSSDATPGILADYAARFPRMRWRRNSCNGGTVAAFQRAFWLGEAEFVMPKAGDDPIAPDFVARIMEVLLAHPECAMCHAAGLVFSGESAVRGAYPATHRLAAVGADQLARAIAVMRTYTSSPSFWGIYRRSATEQLAPIAYRAGWDHVLLAELALYGEIRHVPEILYWRRDGGRAVADLARRATLAVNRHLPLGGPLVESRWRTPLITTAYAHLECFAAARIDEANRRALMAAAPEIFRRRWMPALQAEAAALRREVPALIAAIGQLPPALVAWASGQIAEALRAVTAILPEENFASELCKLAMLPPHSPTTDATLVV